MDSPWLFLNLGKIAQITGFATLILIGVVVLLRRRKGRKLRNRDNAWRGRP